MTTRFIGITLPIQDGNISGMFNSSTSIQQQARSNLKNLILTKKGERLAQPEFGCDIWSVLFTNNIDEVQDLARIAVVEAVDRWLPYLLVLDVTLSPETRENTISMRCTYAFRQDPRQVGEIEVNISST
jgi:phage baseplate assembly protein W